MKMPPAPSDAITGSFWSLAALDSRRPAEGQPLATVPREVLRWTKRFADPVLQSCHAVNAPPAPSLRVEVLFCSPPATDTGFPFGSHWAEAGRASTALVSANPVTKTRRRIESPPTNP